MTLYRRFFVLSVVSAMVMTAVYLSGCSSAESTTGKLAFQQQDYKKAEVELKKGLEIDKNDDEGWYMLGYSQIENGEFKDASESFKRSLAISNNFADQIKSFWVQKYNNGASDFKSGIDAENKKDTATARGHYRSALMNFEASYSILPDSLKSYSAMGETYLALGQNDKAIEVLNTIAEKSKNPKDAEKVARVLFNAGLNLMQTNNYKSAIPTFQNVLAIPSLPKNDPYYETSAYNLGLAFAKTGEDMRNKDENSDFRGQFRESLKYLEPLTISLTKKDLEPQIWELLVSVYANLGMTDKAKDALEKSNSLKNK